MHFWVVKMGLRPLKAGLSGTGVSDITYITCVMCPTDHDKAGYIPHYGTEG